MSCNSHLHERECSHKSSIMAPIRLDFDKYRYSAPLNALEPQKPQESGTARDGAATHMNEEGFATPASSTRSENGSDEASYNSSPPDIAYPVDINARAKYKTRVGKASLHLTSIIPGAFDLHFVRVAPDTLSMESIRLSTHNTPRKGDNVQGGRPSCRRVAEIWYVADRQCHKRLH